MGPLRRAQEEIEKRSLPGGGWATGNGQRAGIETTCYALMALHDRQAPACDRAINLLLRTQNPDGSWPAFEGDDPEGCWTTALAAIALRFIRSPAGPLKKAVSWLLNYEGREGHWFWRWKFRTVDRAVQFNPEKYGWPWFSGTVSWVIPTAFSLIALKQSFPCCRTGFVANRIQLGTEMLRDRACPQGGWNAGNGIVFGSPLTPHIDTTAIALLALTEDRKQPSVFQALNSLRQASLECSSAYSLAWTAVALLILHDQGADLCITRLHTVLDSNSSMPNTETLSLASIAINVAQGKANPFEVR